MRKLASIRRIADIQPIPNADAIEVASIDGWKVVTAKDNGFKVGDLVIYLEIDSWVPHELAPFLSKGKEPREYNGVKGERLRTVKLRGQVSQGLILPLQDCFEFNYDIQRFMIKDGLAGQGLIMPDPEEGLDITEELAIQKWEAPISAQMQGVAKGNFPTHLIPKTDQERIQNCFKDVQRRDGINLTKKVWNEKTQTLEEHDVVLPEDFQKPTYEKTLKLDGSSCTIFRWEGELRVCSRNMELKINEENADNTFVRMALRYADAIGEGLAFQGEVMGPGIQGNREGLKDHEFFVFDIWDIKDQFYYSPQERVVAIKKLNLCSVPVLDMDTKAPESVDAALADADGPSLNHKVREGVVYKCNEDPSFSFKVISNKYLLKGGN